MPQNRSPFNCMATLVLRRFCSENATRHLSGNISRSVTANREIHIHTQQTLFQLPSNRGRPTAGTQRTLLIAPAVIGRIVGNRFCDNRDGTSVITESGRKGNFRNRVSLVGEGSSLCSGALGRSGKRRRDSDRIIPRLRRAVPHKPPSLRQAEKWLFFSFGVLLFVNMYLFADRHLVTHDNRVGLFKPNIQSPGYKRRDEDT